MTAKLFRGFNLHLIDQGLEGLKLSTESVIQMGNKPFARHVKKNSKALKDKKIDPAEFQDQVYRYCFQ